jgi:hypothetical protein
MSQVGQVPQSPEYLRGLYRALGMSEQTIERAIQYRDGPGEPAPQGKPGRGRPRQNVRIMDRPAPTGSVKRRVAKRKRA